MILIEVSDKHTNFILLWNESKWLWNEGKNVGWLGYDFANISWITEKAREFKKNIYFCFIDYGKILTMWITTNCGKFLKRWEYRTTLPASWEICMQVRKQQVEPDMEQWAGSKLGKEYVKAVYCHPAYLIYIQSTSWEMTSWMKHKLESRLLGKNIHNIRYADDTTLMAEGEEELKSLLMKVKEESEKVGLKLSIQKAKIMASGPITSWWIDGETMQTVRGFSFGGLQNHCIWWLQPWN